jgi:hypothetical protein
MTSNQLVQRYRSSASCPKQYCILIVNVIKLYTCPNRSCVSVQGVGNRGLSCGESGSVPKRNSISDCLIRTIYTMLTELNPRMSYLSLLWDAASQYADKLTVIVTPVHSSEKQIRSRETSKNLHTCTVLEDIFFFSRPGSNP